MIYWLRRLQIMTSQKHHKCSVEVQLKSLSSVPRHLRIPRVAVRGSAETDQICLVRNSQTQFYAVVAIPLFHRFITESMIDHGIVRGSGATQTFAEGSAAAKRLKNPELRYELANSNAHIFRWSYSAEHRALSRGTPVAEHWPRLMTTKWLLVQQHEHADFPTTQPIPARMRKWWEKTLGENPSFGIDVTCRQQGTVRFFHVLFFFFFMFLQPVDSHCCRKTSFQKNLDTVGGHQSFYFSFVHKHQWCDGTLLRNLHAICQKQGSQTQIAPRVKSGFTKQPASRIMTIRSTRGILYDAYATMAAAEPY